MKRPTEVEVITYQVGFGDCFLLKVRYDRGRPHAMLIDFGSTRTAGFSLTKVARAIAADCVETDGLDAVVATHRHKDHVHGFARTASGGGTCKVIRDLEPRVVIQPWTEDPRAQPDAVRPTKKYGAQGPAFAARLVDMQSLAGAIGEFGRGLRRRAESELRQSLRALGENNLGNASAMANLRSMGRRQYYAYHGMRLRVARELPGVVVHVLGPPTLEQSAAIDRQRSEDEDEFWHLAARAETELVAGAGPFAGHRTLGDPVWARWVRRRLRSARAEQLLSIVRSLDHAMNNTSLVLLLEIGDKRLLFPGDAQYENWAHALSKAWVRRLLGGVDVYKVGHHGSLNATPKSMFAAFAKRRSQLGEGVEPMYSLLSTKAGVHGSPARRTEVPRSTLVKTLDDETVLLSTEQATGISRSVTLAVG